MNKLARLIEAHWRHPRLWLTGLLWPLSRWFASVARARAWLYRHGIFKSGRLPVPVLVIGNVHIGGSGKTPITAATVQALQARGVRVGVISRGYGRQNQNVVVVDTNGSPDDYGDEPLLLARITGAPVVVGADRVAAGRLLLQRFPATQLIVSDDGLQHYRLARDREIVVFPATDLARRLDVLPNGALREPLSRLRYADALMIANDAAHAALPSWLPSGLTVYRSRLTYGALYALNRPEHTVSPSFFCAQKVIALAAIARPQRFFDALRQQGITLAATLTLPDHAPLSPADVPQNADAVIVTAKDAVKLAAFALPQVWVLPVCAIIPDDLITELCRAYVR